MKKVVQLMLGAFCVAAMSVGCVSNKITVENGGGGAGVDEGSAVGSAEMSALSVAVKTQGSGADASAVAERLSVLLLDSLTGRSVQVVDSGADLLVELQVSAKLRDVAGEFEIYEGGVVGKARVAATRKSLGSLTKDVVGERKLGKAKALDSLAGKLAESAGPWAERAVTSGSKQLSVADLSISLTQWKSKSKVDEYSVKFVNLVSRQEGVISCRILKQDVNRRKVVFKVVYDPAFFPSGLLNALCGIESLNLNPEFAR